LLKNGFYSLFIPSCGQSSSLQLLLRLLVVLRRLVLPALARRLLLLLLRLEGLGLALMAAMALQLARALQSLVHNRYHLQ
jgi:hypothetical protein